MLPIFRDALEDYIWGGSYWIIRSISILPIIIDVLFFFNFHARFTGMNVICNNIPDFTDERPIIWSTTYSDTDCTWRRLRLFFQIKKLIYNIFRRSVHCYASQNSQSNEFGLPNIEWAHKELLINSILCHLEGTLNFVPHEHCANSY